MFNLIDTSFIKGAWRKVGSEGAFVDVGDVRLSSAVSQAMDFDKDTSTVMVAGPNTKE
jgi:hypothetical protein